MPFLSKDFRCCQRQTHTARAVYTTKEYVGSTTAVINQMQGIAKAEATAGFKAKTKQVLQGASHGKTEKYLHFGW